MTNYLRVCNVEHMFLTRIQRGAIRTRILVMDQAESLGFRYRRIVPSGMEMRTLAVTMTAAYTAMMPAMAVRAQAAAPSQLSGSLTEEATEPPSAIPGLVSDAIQLVRATPQVTTTLQVNVDHLNDISVGKSIDTLDQEAQEAQRQADIQAQAEQARILLQQQQAAAAAAKARQIALVAATIPVGGVMQTVHDLAVGAFGEDQWPALQSLINRESGFNPNSYNTSSGACGLFQALPCSKMGGMDVINQVNWGIGYIKNRYGSPSIALDFHNRFGWY